MNIPPMDFCEFPKISRLSREMIISEKIDGTNSTIYITDNLEIYAGSRNRWITPEDDNYGFARWVQDHEDDLVSLGPGLHRGEWWGCLASEVSITLADGSTEKIGKIVNNRLPVTVLSYNFDTHKIEPKKVIGWKRGPSTNDWLTIRVRRKWKGGKQTCVNLTPNHIVFRKNSSGQQEECPAGELHIGDILYINSEVQDIKYSELQNLAGAEIVEIDRAFANSRRSKYRFDLEIEDNHNFFANNILVHNSGIQRKYGLSEKRFSLFNTSRWCLWNAEPMSYPTADPRIINTQERLPECCHLVPELYRGLFDTATIDQVLEKLKTGGSVAAPGFMKPEGIVIFHVAANTGFKKTIEKDEEPKSRNKNSDIH